MQVSVKALLGLGRIPTHRTSATKWLLQRGVNIGTAQGIGGKFEQVGLSDLPAPERLAYVERLIADLGLALGSYDDTAHEAFMLVDVASNMVLDYELAPSENAADTVRVIKRICQRFGIPDRIYTDNGSSFAGHMVAGGNVHRFRNGGKKPEGIQPPGICKQMGIKLHFALPKNAQAKIAERTFATLHG